MERVKAALRDFIELALLEREGVLAPEAVDAVTKLFLRGYVALRWTKGGLGLTLTEEGKLAVEKVRGLLAVNGDRGQA